MGGVTYHNLKNVGRVDYYAIQPDGTPELVKSSSNKRSYDVRGDMLFEAMDDLFPKGSGPIE